MPIYHERAPKMHDYDDELPERRREVDEYHILYLFVASDRALKFPSLGVTSCGRRRFLEHHCMPVTVDERWSRHFTEFVYLYSALMGERARYASRALILSIYIAAIVTSIGLHLQSVMMSSA